MQATPHPSFKATSNFPFSGKASSEILCYSGLFGLQAAETQLKQTEAKISEVISS